jgi:hypothetical protein
MSTESLPALPQNIRPGASIRQRDISTSVYRPVSVRLPIYVQDVVLPKADGYDALTVAMAARKRVVPLLPRALDIGMFERLTLFVSNWLNENLRPLAADSDVSVEHWLAEANYPAWRKEELRLYKDDLVIETPRDSRTKSFLKDEFYPELKHPRTINPRNDRFKVFSGPIFHEIEKALFKMKWFVKFIPVADRSNYVIDQIYSPNSTYFATDYSSFESSFTAEAMNAMEMKLYRHMSALVKGGDVWYDTIHRVLTGPQQMVFRNVTVTTQATRMSGDMCTSLGNGFSNLMLMLFAGQEFGLGELYACFEGDDGIGRFSSGRLPDPVFFEHLGFTVKMETHTDIASASFCGIVCDLESRQQMTDPKQTLATFGWAQKIYANSKNSTLMALLRAKALSYAHAYPHCPLISPFVRRIIYLTRGIDHQVVLKHKATSLYDRMWYQQAFLAHKLGLPEFDPTMKTRLLCEKLYGISVEQQLKIESSMQTMEIGGFPIDLDFPSLWRRMYDEYVCPLTKDANPLFRALVRVPADQQ